MNNDRLHFEIAQTNKTLKVKLRTPKGVYDFRVDVRRLERAAQWVRDTLTAVCMNYLKPPSELSSSNQALLQDLAMHGDTMRSVFFSGQKQLATILRTDFAHSPITFDLHKVKYHAPWGLMFDVPENISLQELTDAQLREGFWRMSHRLSVVHAATDGPLLGEPREETVDDTTVLAVFHTGALNYADPQRKIRWSNEFTSLIDFLRYLRDHPDDSLILYFFCHAKENTLFISKSDSGKADELKPEDLMNALENDSHNRKGGMVFLNGCKTGVSKNEYSWQVATRYRGLAGYVGTEAIIPTRFAWSFGNDLLYLLASGATPESAMRLLRERHWPLSLLYGTYCIPDSRVTNAHISKSLSKPSSINYCSLRLLESGEDLHATLPFLSSH